MTPHAGLANAANSTSDYANHSARSITTNRVLP